MDPLFKEITVTVNNNHADDGGNFVIAFFRGLLQCDIVINDIKIVDTKSGIILAMPSKKISDHCAYCNRKCSVDFCFCPYCGVALNFDYCDRVYRDVVHAINQDVRDQIYKELSDEYKRRTGKAINDEQRG